MDDIYYDIIEQLVELAVAYDNPKEDENTEKSEKLNKLLKRMKRKDEQLKDNVFNNPETKRQQK